MHLKRAVLSILVALFLFPALSALGQDARTFPESRRARVAEMIGHSTVGSATGGWKVVLRFEDDLQPDGMTLWVNKRRYDRTKTGDLFVAHYRPNGTMINIFGPINEGD